MVTACQPGKCVELEEEFVRIRRHPAGQQRDVAEERESLQEQFGIPIVQNLRPDPCLDVHGSRGKQEAIERALEAEEWSFFTLVT